MCGADDVETFVRNGDTIPPLLTDALRWRQLTVDFKWDETEDCASSLTVVNNSSLTRFLLRVDTATRTVPPMSLRDTSRTLGRPR
jgi:hypothetical protein